MNENTGDPNALHDLFDKRVEAEVSFGVIIVFIACLSFLSMTFVPILDPVTEQGQDDQVQRKRC